MPAPDDAFVPDEGDGTSDAGDDTPPASDVAESDAGGDAGDIVDLGSVGVPDAVRLSPSGSIKVTQDGAVIDGLDIAGCVAIEADNVVIRRSRIRCASDAHHLRVMPGHTGAVIENVEIDGGGNADANGIVGDHLTVRRTDVHGVGDGIKIGSNSVYENNYIHDLAFDGEKHNDGMQASGETTDVVIRGNIIQHVRRQTSAILLKADLGPISNVRIENNRLNGGSYTLYVYSAKYRTSGIAVHDNFFGDAYLFGSNAIRNVSGLDWEGNVAASSNTTVQPRQF